MGLTGVEKHAKHTNIVDTSRAAIESAHRKLMTTAYHLAMTPTMPLAHFEVLVKVQRTNGVKLIRGKHDERSAKEYVSSLMDAVEEKCAVILASKHFMTILSDGSQARKTKSDKEMVLVRIERNGLPCYLVASLIEMSEWGGTGAEALKDGIDAVFNNTGPFKMEADDYTAKLVGCTADGASVNFGQYSGLLTRLDEGRGWLIKIHCANHRIELAIKDAFKDSIFTEVDNTYITLYNLLKNSGKIKSEVKSAAEALNIEHYTLPKLTGTRFVGHRVTAYKVMLDMWPALLTALQNVEADGKTKSDVRAKVSGLAKKLKSYNLLCKTCFYLDLLEAVRPTSKIFEGEGLMIFEVKSTVNETMLELEDFAAFDSLEDDLTSHVRRFYMNDHEENTGEFNVKFYAPGDGRRKEKNRHYTCIDILPLINVSSATAHRIFQAKISLASKIKDMLENRFLNSYSDDILDCMKWFDCRNWLEDKTYAYEDFDNLYNHFQQSLDHAGYNHDQIKKEWGVARRYILSHFSKNDSCKDIWRKIILTKREELPNLCLLVELIISFSGSNSSVERTFSLLTNMLSDRRLSTSHETMNILLKLKLSDSLWNDIERDEIIDRALEIYLTKRRVTQIDCSVEPPAKRIREEEPEKDKYGITECVWVNGDSDLSDSE